MSRPCGRSLGVDPSPGPRSRGLGSSAGSLPGSRSINGPSRRTATPRPSGGSAVCTRARACPASWHDRGDPGDRPGFPPLQRARIVPLACLEPSAQGLHITHWTRTDLARQAVGDGIVPALSDRTIREIHNGVDLQPHRTRSGKTSRLDPEFKERAETILGCYANADRLARRGYGVVGVDETPNFQVLERSPIRRSLPGSIEPREFESTRHGTVHILVFLMVPSGQREAACIATKDAKHDIEELTKFRRRPRHLRGAYLIHDGDPSPTAAATADSLAGCGRGWRSRFTPVHAAGLDQAELLLDGFGYRSLKRGSWQSRPEFIADLGRAWPEFNRLDDHPFEWTGTNHKMRQWYESHKP